MTIANGQPRNYRERRRWSPARCRGFGRGIAAALSKAGAQVVGVARDRARLELLAAEKELTRRSDELSRQRQQLPWVRIGKAYRFDTDHGPASFADLFAGTSQLLITHFMFGSGYTAGCPTRSALADGFDGSVIHLNNHDVTLCAVSRAPLARLQACKARMGWSCPWVS